MINAGENTDAGIDGYALPKTGSVTGFVYQDFFSDGSFNGSDTPIAGVPVTLTVNGETFETVTDANGKYTFENVPVGDAQIMIDESFITNQYPDAVQTAGVNPSNVTVVADTLTDAGEDGYNFRHCGFIRGFVYLDKNENGVFDNGIDERLSGVTVSLLPEGHLNPIEVTTNALGIWEQCIFKPQGTKVTVTVLGNGVQLEGTNPNDVNLNLGFLVDGGNDGFSSFAP